MPTVDRILTLIERMNELERALRELQTRQRNIDWLVLRDEAGAPDAISGIAFVYIDNDGSLKVKYGDGSTETFAGGVESFLDLDDTPSDYAGQGGKLVRVNATPDGLEFVEFSDLTGISGDVVGTSDNQTLTNKLLDDATSGFVDSADATKQIRFFLDGLTPGTTRTYVMPNFNATLATLAGAETLTNKTLTTPVITVRGTQFTVQDPSDATKQAQFDASGIAAGNTRTYTMPDASGTLALLGLAQTFSAKQTFSGGINLGDEDLNTYNEIPYTPVIGGSGSNPTVTYSVQQGLATQIGRVIHYAFRVVINTISGGSGNLTISTPAAATTFTQMAACLTRNVDLGGTPVNVVFIAQTAGAFGVIAANQDNADRQIVQVSDLANGDEIQVTGTIHV